MFSPTRTPFSALVAILLILNLVSASNHNLQPRRRHHSKPARRLAPNVSGERQGKELGTPTPHPHSSSTGKDGGLFGKIKRDECEYGSWRCLGLELQRCFGGTFNTLRTCETAGMICSTDPSQTGCIWAWQGSSAASSSSSSDSSASSSGSGEGTAVMGTVVAAVGVESSVIPTPTLGPTATEAPTGSAQASAAMASSTISVAPWYTGSSSGSSSGWVSAPSTTTIPTSTESTTTSTSAMGSSELGAQWVRTDGSTWSQSTSGWTEPSTPTGTGTGTGTASATATGTATVTDSAGVESIDVWGSWTHKKGKHHSTSTSSASASASASDWESTTTISTDPWTATTTLATGSISHDLSTLVPTASSTPSPALGSSAHYVIYSDAWLVDMPHTSAVQGYNKFILAFWLSDKGAADNAAFWESLSAEEQKTVVKAYKDAGITLMVSAFGSTDHPITDGRDPTEVAQALAGWVISNNMAGVDIDLEDDTAMNNGQFIDWVVTFQKELRKQLPQPYLISHAPQAPWFTSADKWGGGYVKIHDECGDGIDFYNIQYYNQGDDQYNTCENLLFDSGSSFPDSSVFQTHTVSGVPLEKLVIGKPINAGAAANGYMDAATLNGCVNQAKAKGWNAGVMYWEYDSTAVGTILAVVG